MALPSLRSSASCTRHAPWSGCSACGAPCTSSPSISCPSCTPAVPARSRRESGSDGSSSSRAQASRTIRAGGSSRWSTRRCRRCGRAAKRPRPSSAVTCPRSKLQLDVGEGTKWAGTISASTRVLALLAADGQIVRGRPRGSWTSSQYRWAPMSSWLPSGREGTGRGRGARRARGPLAARRYGPGTVADIKWWTGWTVGEVRRALADLASRRSISMAAPGSCWPSDLAPVRAPAAVRGAAPGSRHDRDGLDRARLVPRAARTAAVRPIGQRRARRSGGTGGSSAAGRNEGAVRSSTGSWRTSGADAMRAIDAEAERLTSWLGSARVTPRFRTPLERERWRRDRRVSPDDRADPRGTLTR